MSKEKKTAETATELEFHEKVNAHAAHAAQQRQQDEERARMAAEAERVNRETRRAKYRRKATRNAIAKAVVTLATIAGLWLAVSFNLIHPVLAVPCMVAALAWATFWAGAWVQFMWPKGGLYHAE